MVKAEFTDRLGFSYEVFVRLKRLSIDIEGLNIRAEDVYSIQEMISMQVAVICPGLKPKHKR